MDGPRTTDNKNEPLLSGRGPVSLFLKHAYFLHRVSRYVSEVGRIAQCLGYLGTDRDRVRNRNRRTGKRKKTGTGERERERVEREEMEGKISDR